jgi:thioredoxin reductase (NADPH)
MSTVRHTKVLIIGAGAAGLTAAIYAARANLSPVVIQGLQPGGQLTITTDVENYPGFAEAIQGPWLMEQMAKQAMHCGAELLFDLVAGVDFSERPFRLWLDGGATWTADVLIIATGAQARWLGLDSESHFSGAGVSACATCDGFFFRGKPVAIVGGGNTAVEEALYLAQMCQHVTLVHRRNSLRAEKVMQDRLFAHPKTVTGVRVRHVHNGEAHDLKVDGLFVAIGHDPATEIFRGHLDMDGEGYVVTEPGTTRTSVEGVFAAGDVQDKIYRQAVTAAGSGCMAALDAERFLAGIG